MKENGTKAIEATGDTVHASDDNSEARGKETIPTVRINIVAVVVVNGNSEEGPRPNKDVGTS